MRGINRDTALAKWWESDGRHIIARIAARDNALYLAAKTGFVFGWIARQKRDAKLKRTGNAK